MSGRILVFAVGAETFLDDSLATAPFAENDAKAFVDAWKRVGASDEEIAVLVGVQATLTTVRSRLRRLLKLATAEDRVVCFYAGQAVTTEDGIGLVTHDTQTDDAEGTTLPLAELLATLSGTKAAQSILFLDAARASGDAGDEAFSPVGEQAEEALRAWCARSNARVAFVSCGPHERSYASRELGRGLWTHAIVEALRGEHPAALSKKRYLTTASLQAWLSEALPTALRKTIAGVVTQTPALFSNGGSVVLVDMDSIPGRDPGRSDGARMLPRASLVGAVGGRVKELSGYKKPKQPLGSHSRWEREFVQAAGVREVSEQAEALYEEIRRSFDFKRREIGFACDGPVASIRTPAFDVDLSLDQDDEDATRYLIRTHAFDFRRPEVVGDAEFLRIFDARCDRVVIELDTPLDIEAKIDEIESVDALADLLQYDREATQFTLRLPGLHVRLHATASRIAFHSEGRRDLKSLIENASKAVGYLAGAGTTLRLPGS